MLVFSLLVRVTLCVLLSADIVAVMIAWGNDKAE